MGTTALVVVIVVVALGVRLHERLPRLGERDRHVHLDQCADPAGGPAHGRRLQRVGALVSTEVAKTIGGGIIAPPEGHAGLVIVLAALVGAIVWNLGTWYFGLPSSSSHALIGGLVGAALGRRRGSAVERPRRQGRHPDGRLAADRVRGQLPLHARVAVGLPEGERPPGAARLPLGPDRLGGDHVLRSRHPGRPEDHGRHRADPRRVGTPRQERRHPVLGHRCPPRRRSRPALTPAAGASCARWAGASSR